MTLRLAFADTAGAAHALARYQALPAKDELRPFGGCRWLALELDPEATKGLLVRGSRRLGIWPSGRWRASPPASAARPVTALRHLLGEASRPMKPLVPIAPVSPSGAFAEPVARTEYALEVLGELTAEAARQMEERGEAAGGSKPVSSEATASPARLQSRPASRPAIPPWSSA
jgi:protein ImuB